MLWLKRSQQSLFVSLVLSLLVSLCCSQAVMATPERESIQVGSKSLQVFGSLATTVGTGSFANSSYKNHFVAQSLSLGLDYSFLNGTLSATGNWGFDLEYTQPDNASGRAFLPRDVGLGFHWNNPVKTLSKIIGQRLSLNAFLPTSLLSQVSTRVLRLELAMRLNARLGWFSVIYTFGVARGFHRYTSPVFDQTDAELPSILLRQSARQRADLPEGMVVQPGSRNVAWQLRNMLLLRFRLHRTLSFNVTFVLFNAFKYAMPNDEFRPVIPTTQGDVKADLVGRSDFTLGNLSLTWQPLRHLAVSLSAQTIQAPMNASNSGLRLPFLNLATANDNNTTFSLTLIGQY